MDKLDRLHHLLRGHPTPIAIAQLARIEQIRVVAHEIAKEVPPAILNIHVLAGFGLFAGKNTEQAALRFAAPIAQEIAIQEWHPQQQGQWDGKEYLLSLPYSKPKELIQDILKHIPYIAAKSPASLREAMKQRLSQVLQQHDEYWLTIQYPIFFTFR